MITRVEHISDEQLRTIRQIIGEAFVSNELFHNWGNVDERKNDVIKYMSIYVDYAYQAGELYANEDLTGFIGLEDSAKKDDGKIPCGCCHGDRDRSLRISRN